jgi:hypothetical protein
MPMEQPDLLAAVLVRSNTPGMIAEEPTGNMRPS